MNAWEWFVTVGATCGIAAFLLVIWLLAAYLAAVAGQEAPEPEVKGESPERIDL